MAKINLADTSTWKNWIDGQVMTAEDYKRERNTMITAINLIDDEAKETKDYILITQLMGVF